MSFSTDDRPVATGVEAEVCQDIARRQQLGIQKYGVSVANNPLTHVEWLQHAYEESLNHAIYLKRAMNELRDNGQWLHVKERVYFREEVAPSRYETRAGLVLTSDPDGGLFDIHNDVDVGDKVVLQVVKRNPDA